MEEFIATKGPLSIFKHKWIARAFTKDITKNIPMKTDNWLEESVQNPPGLNLVYTLREYQPYEDEFLDAQYKFLGPSIYKRKSQGFDFEKSERPIVYISLGTLIKGSLSFFQNYVDAFRGENMDVIISVGQKFNVKKLKKRISLNIYIYKTVPQLDVLKITDVFVTHGGMNSVSEALVYGTPMVVIPFASDQPVNARCIGKLGVDKKLDYSMANKNTIKSTVFAVVLDSNIKTNLARVQRLITKAPGNKGGAEFVIQYYSERA